MKKFIRMTATVLAVAPIACAQISAAPEIEVKFLDPAKASPTASIDDLAWMAGRWQSDATPTSFSGDIEHVILDPRDGQMPGLVRVMERDGGYMMFELSTFLEVDGTLTYRNRHFAPDLVAWQPPEDYVDRRLVEINPDAAYFHGITFLNTGPDEMGVAFVLTGDDGVQTKYTLDYINVSID